MSFWGYHMLLDCSQCNKEAITDPTVLETWIRDLVKRIGMVPYGDPQIVHFGHNEEHLAGWTVIQLIETSNIIAHFCDNSGEGYIDIFSCKDYDDEVAIATVNEYFSPKKMRKTWLTRQAD